MDRIRKKKRSEGHSGRNDTQNVGKNTTRRVTSTPNGTSYGNKGVKRPQGTSMPKSRGENQKRAKQPQKKAANSEYRQKRYAPKQMTGNASGYRKPKRVASAGYKPSTGYNKSGKNNRGGVSSYAKGSKKRTQTRPVRRMRRKSERNSSTVMAVAAVFIFIIVVVYLALYTARNMSVTAIKNEVVKLGTIETPYSAQGIVVRNESVFTCDTSGIVEYYFADNEKVKSGQKICLVKNAENLDSMEGDLEKLDEQLLNLQSYRDELSVSYNNFKKYNTDIAAVAEELAADLSRNDVSAVSKLKERVSDLWTKRNLLVMADDSGSAQELAGLRREQEDKVSQQISYVANEKGGILSYYVDGFEDKYNFESVLLDSEIPQSETEQGTETANLVKSMINAGDPVFKMVYSNEWYIALYIESDYIVNWEPDTYVDVYITGKTQASKGERAYLKSIRRGDKYSYVVLKMERNIIDYMMDRFVSVKVSKADRGYKILNTAITDQNLLAVPDKYILCDDEESVKKHIEPYVLKVGDEGNENIDVKIASRDEENGIVYVQIEYGKINIGTVLDDPAAPGSTYILDKLDSVKGIFVTNSGMTKFKKIDLTDSVSNDTHTVLSIECNPNIDVYDRYAADASSVYADEKTVRPSI